MQDISAQLYRTKKARKRKESSIDMIVIHHDAAPPPKSGNWIARLQAYAHQHANEGWGGLGYHYVIAPDGTTFKCNPYTDITVHAGGANSRAIGIMLMGNFHIDGNVPSGAQLTALSALTVVLKQAIPTITHIIPHREVRHGTACPGQNFKNNMIPFYAK